MSIEKEHHDTDIGMLQLFGKETLENLQEIIAKVTGLGVITADFRGEPLTNMTSFTPFCKFIRKKGNNGKLCNLSDAFGIVRSAITKKYCVYFCPCGLMEVAIPIIVQGKFLGGFLAGQVRCDDAPDDVPRFSGMIHPEYDPADKETADAYFSQIPVYEYRKFSDIAELIYLMVNQLAENEMLRQQQYESHKIEEKQLASKINELEYEKASLERELNYIFAKTNPHFLLGSLTDLSNLALLENAPNTNRMVVRLAQLLRHTLCDTSESITLAKEFEQIAIYFSMLKIKYKENFTYSMTMKKEMDMQKIPSHVLFCFLERMVSFITLNTGKLHIDLGAVCENDFIVIQITADYNPDKAAGNTESSFKNFPDSDNFHTTVSHIRQRLYSIFGNKYEIKEHYHANTRIENLIKFPIYYNERIL